MSLGGGDQLARGAKSAVFPSCSHIPQEKWDECFGPRPLNIAKPDPKPKKAKKN